jgi:hypothetical protein
MVLFLLLFSFSAFAQSSLSDYGPARISGRSIFEAPVYRFFLLDQAPNGVNGLFADSSCALCPTGQQSIAENFIVTNLVMGIAELVIWGGYYPENIPNTMDDFTILFHSDSGGIPGPVLYSWSDLQAASREPTGVVLFGCDEYVFTFDLRSYPIFFTNPGTYWIEIFNNSVESGNFFWETGNLDTSHGIQGICWVQTTPGTTWNLDSETDLAIQIIESFWIPVELVSFEATASGTDVDLNWETASETNNKGFSIERSSGSGFETIGYVAGSGTTTESRCYTFTDNKLVSGTYTYRLKQVDFGGTFKYSDIIEVEVAPSIFSLKQNYPNPFNVTTIIRFSIPKETQVNLSLYNILGEQVKELKNEFMKPGYFEVEFDASTVASGVYFYQLKAGDFVQTKKMILLK